MLATPRPLVDDRILIAVEEPGDTLDPIQQGRDAETEYEQGCKNLPDILEHHLITN